MKKKYLAIALLICSTLTISLGFSSHYIENHPEIEFRAIAASSTLEIDIAEKVSLTIVYDNNPYDERLKTAWGFACHIDADGMSILFDTGGDHSILLDNMAKSNIDVREIEIIVLSHIHGDHVGGLFGLLELNSQVKVDLPASFPEDFKRRVEGYGYEVIEVKDALKICNGVATAGELGTAIMEQSLVVATVKGLVIVTGCAHPGVANIVKKAKELTGIGVYLVLGGFHLNGAPENTLLSVIEQFRELEVLKVAPCHCSGDRARALFKEEFGADYMEVGVGADP